MLALCLLSPLPWGPAHPCGTVDGGPQASEARCVCLLKAIREPRLPQLGDPSQWPACWLAESRWLRGVLSPQRISHVIHVLPNFRISTLLKMFSLFLYSLHLVKRYSHISFSLVRRGSFGFLDRILSLHLLGLVPRGRLLSVSSAGGLCTRDSVSKFDRKTGHFPSHDLAAREIRPWPARLSRPRWLPLLFVRGSSCAGSGRCVFWAGRRHRVSIQ